ncbi:MAG: hypothetical protein RIR33_3385 [Pseudomonadota bacterium]|jgi:AcrR family transcriptional regulator
MVEAALGRREQNKLDKRRRILAAARTLFMRKGFDATTSQEIADASGVAGGTVFTYARTKEDLLILVFHEEMAALVETAFRSSRRRKSLLKQVATFFDAIVAYHEQDIPLARVLMRQLGYVASPEQRGLVSDLMGRLFGRLEQLFADATDRGELSADFATAPAARAAFAIYYLHLGAMLNGYIDRPQFDRVLRSDLEFLLSGRRHEPVPRDHALRPAHKSRNHLSDP